VEGDVGDQARAGIVGPLGFFNQHTRPRNRREGGLPPEEHHLPRLWPHQPAKTIRTRTIGKGERRLCFQSSAPPGRRTGLPREPLGARAPAEMRRRV